MKSLDFEGFFCARNKHFLQNVKFYINIDKVSGMDENVRINICTKK